MLQVKHTVKLTFVQLFLHDLYLGMFMANMLVPITLSLQFLHSSQQG